MATIELPTLVCPTCNLPVDWHSYEPGYAATVPGAGLDGGDAHMIGTSEQMSALPGYGPGGETRLDRHPDADIVTVHPCGHRMEGDDAARFMHAFLEARVLVAEQERRKAVELAAHQIVAALTGHDLATLSHTDVARLAAEAVTT